MGPGIFSTVALFLKHDEDSTKKYVVCYSQNVHRMEEMHRTLQSRKMRPQSLAGLYV